MTNKEKEQYLSDMMIFRSQAFCCELNKRKDFYNKMPKTLYKYRPFDKYSYEMLEEQYLYLTPVKDLDDPFDCLIGTGIDSNVKDNGSSIGLSMIDYVVKVVSELGNVSIDKKEVKKLIRKSYVDGEYNEDNARMAFDNSDLVSEREKEKLLFCLRNLDETVKTVVNDQSIANLAKIMIDPGDKIGICSLSEKRDNKVMWSLYCDKYSGYCVEYDIPNDQDIRFSLCPVIYKNNDGTDFVKLIIKYAIAVTIRLASEGQLNNGIGCMNEFLCKKDRSWSYQEEWRLIGDAGQHAIKPKIKAVYLGFKVKEDNLKMVKEIAKKNGFKVFLMDTPKGSNKITYTQVM